MTFDHEGKTYEVDLGADNRAALADALAPYKAVGRRADGTTKLDRPKWACETSRCASMPANARDPYTGTEL